MKSDPAARAVVFRAALSCLAAAAPALVLAARLEAAEPGPTGARLELGFEERVRTENSDDATDFEHDAVDARHQWRFRTRVWAKLDAGARTTFVAGLNNESRKLTTPRVALTMDETLFETLYLEHRFAGDVLVRAGRQNLTRGDGFILMDGGPLDGSRTAYFNALDAGWTRGRRRLDLLLVSDTDRDQYLPAIHDRHRALIEWDERAIGLYGVDSSMERTTLDAYWFFKTETADTRAAANAARQPDRRFHTAGARATRDMAGDWSLKVEFAGQLGRQEGGAKVRAWGGQASLRRAFPGAPARPAVAVGWVALSGDDPATAANEGWDPLFSRFPKWSELYIYTLGAERGAAYWTNLSMGVAEVQLAPARSLDARLVYLRLGAFHRFPGAPSLLGDGTRRGDLLIARADLKLDDHWRGHLLGERLAPGDFYTGDDTGWFFRAEVTFEFKRTFGT